MNLFPNYDLKEDLEESYVEKENAIVKKFIKTGISFVKKNSVNVKNFISYMKINEEACDNIIENVPVSEINSDTSVAELSQFGFSPDAIKTPNINSEVSDDSPTEPGGQPEVGNDMLNNSKEQDENIHLGQVDSMDTPIRTPKMKKKRRNKEQRQKRLLKFQQKLVKTSGLPPSRLMEQKNSLDLFKRNLQDEFANLESTDLTPHAAPISPAAPVVPLPVAPVQAQGAPPPAPSAGLQSYGSSSSFNTSPMLCSMTSPWTGGFVGVTSTPGWPDARPVGAFDSNRSQSSHPYFGSSSGSPYHTSLSSSSQYGVGLPNTMLFQSQPNPAAPAPPVGTPAYCFHCLQYGSVFTIYPV